MSLSDWAAKYRLWTLVDTDDTLVVPGASGSIWEYSDDLLGVSFQGTVSEWNNRRRAGVKLGMRCTQDGDAEGNMTFDPGDTAQSKLAIRIAGVPVRRKVSDDTKVRLTRSQDRFGTRQQRSVAARTDDLPVGGLQ